MMFIVAMSIGISLQLNAQTAPENESLEKVFIIGQYQEFYEDLSIDYPKSILEVTNYDMDKAYELWMDLVIQLENYAEKVNVNLNGVQLYLTVYWNSNGAIDYLGFYPKSTSRLIDGSELYALLKTFINEYKGTTTAQFNFSHNASAIFPTSGY